MVLIMSYVIFLDNIPVVQVKKNKIWTCDNIKVAKKFKNYESAINYLKNTPEKDKFQIRLMIKNKGVVRR